MRKKSEPKNRKSLPTQFEILKGKNTELASTMEWTATVLIPISLAVLMTLQAISPRLAIRILLNVDSVLSMGSVE